MRYAVPVSGDMIATHFGHCEKFALIDVDEERAVEKDLPQTLRRQTDNATHSFSHW